MKTLPIFYIVLALGSMYDALAYGQVKMTPYVTLTNTRYNQLLRDTSALKGAALLMMYKNQPDSAVWFASKLADASRTGENLLLLSSAYYLNRNCTQAIHYASEAYNIMQNSFYKNALAYRHYECGDQQAAIIGFRESLEEDPSQSDVVSILIELELAHGKSDSLLAINRLQQLIAADNKSKYHFKYATLLVAQAMNDEAQQQLDELLEEDSLNEDALLLKASIAADDQAHDVAESAMKKLLQIRPDNDSFWSFNARILFQKGDTTGAILSLDHAISLARNNAENYHAMLGILEHSGRKAEQVLYARKASGSGIQDFDAMLTEYDSALSVINSVSDKKSYSSEEKVRVARAYIQTGNYSNAAVLLSSLQQSNPQNKDLNYLLAVSNFQLRRFDAAEQYLQSILTQQSTDADANFMMANIRYRQDKPEEAIRFAQKALSVDPDDKYKEFLLTVYSTHDREAYNTLASEMGIQ